MSDTSAQPTTGLARRFVGNPNSTIGAMMKRGLTGTATATSSAKSAAPAEPPQPNPQPATPTQIQAQPQPAATTTPQENLDILESVIGEVEEALPAEQVNLPADPVSEGVMGQAMPQAMVQAADAADPAKHAVSSMSKEASENVSLDQIAVDAARGAQQVELEPTPEIPPEVEGYLQKVEELKDPTLQEVVIADGSQTTPLSHQYPAQPVVVLPITQEEEKQGAKKSPKFSIRWLVEWSRKLMKVFAGKIVYRPIEESTA